MAFLDRFKMRTEDFMAILGIDYGLFDKLKRLRNRLIFREKDQFEFVEDFKTWLDDDGNVRRACEHIIRSAETLKQGNKPYVQAARDIRDAVVNGRSIAAGMENWFDYGIILVFTVGQKTNTLNRMLDSYMKQQEELKEAKKELIKPLKYPAILMIAALGISFVISQVVMPQFYTLISLDQMNPLTQSFVATFTHLSSYLLLYIIVIIVCFVGIRWWIRNGTGFLRRRCSALFPFNLYSYILAMQLTKMMGLLVGGIYNPYQAAKEIKKTASPFFSWHLSKIIEREEKGSVSIAYSFDTGLLPPRLIQRMDAASSQGGADSQLKALETAGRRSGQEAINAVGRTKVWALLAIWVVIGSLMAWSVSSFLGVFIALSSAY